MDKPENTQPTAPQNGPKVLIIEDDPIVGRMYLNIFTFEKFAVTLSPDGEDGLKKAEEGHFDIILLDIMLPNMNGLEVLEKLRTEPKTKSTPVIMLTNIAGSQALDTALKKGALLYIIKSEYDPKQVVEVVRKALSGNLPGVKAQPETETPPK